MWKIINEEQNYNSDFDSSVSKKEYLLESIGILSFLPLKACFF